MLLSSYIGFSKAYIELGVVLLAYCHFFDVRLFLGSYHLIYSIKVRSEVSAE